MSGDTSNPSPARNSTSQVRDGSRSSTSNNERVHVPSPETEAAVLDGTEVTQADAAGADAGSSFGAPGDHSDRPSAGSASGQNRTPIDPAPAMVNSFERVQARIHELEEHIKLAMHDTNHVLHAIVAADPAWRNEPIQARTRRVVLIWLSQLHTFSLLFMEIHPVDRAALTVARERFGPSPLHKIIHVLEILMKVENGLPAGELSLSTALNLRRAVLEKVLVTLRAWCDDWRRTLPTTHPFYLEPIPEADGYVMSQGEIAAFMAFGQIMENRTDY
jgi:hypothetical protein